MSIFFNKNWFKLSEKIELETLSKDSLTNNWNIFFASNFLPYVTRSITSDAKIFKSFTPSDIDSNKSYILSKSIYSEYVYDVIGTPYISNFYTSSTQDSSFDCITNVYIVADWINTTLQGPIFKNSQEYRIFDIIYGNYYGSGSSNGNIIIYNDSTENYDLSYPSKQFYFSIKKLINNNDEKIQISGSADSVFALNISSAYLYDGISKNSFELFMCKMNGSSSLNELSYLETITKLDSLNDDGSSLPETIRRLYTNREIYSFIELNTDNNSLNNSIDYKYIVSGSLKTGVYLENGMPVIYGKIYYNLGLVIFDANKLSDTLNLNLNINDNVESKNSLRFLKSLQGVLNATVLVTDGSTGTVNPSYPEITESILMIQGNLLVTPKLNVNQQINSIFYKCSIEEHEYNYSTNPSYYDNTDGSMVIRKFYTGSSDLYVKPEAYINSVGLYDSAYNLIAVAKLSHPQRKSLDNKLIINIRVDY
jgi:hypothetical protein